MKPAAWLGGAVLFIALLILSARWSLRQFWKWQRARLDLSAARHHAQEAYLLLMAAAKTFDGFILELVLEWAECARGRGGELDRQIFDGWTRAIIQRLCETDSHWRIRKLSLGEPTDGLSTREHVLLALEFQGWTVALYAAATDLLLLEAICLEADFLPDHRIALAEADIQAADVAVSKAVDQGANSHNQHLLSVTVDSGRQWLVIAARLVGLHPLLACESAAAASSAATLAAEEATDLANHLQMIQRAKAEVQLSLGQAEQWLHAVAEVIGHMRPVYAAHLWSPILDRLQLAREGVAAMRQQLLPALEAAIDAQKWNRAMAVIRSIIAHLRAIAKLHDDAIDQQARLNGDQENLCYGVATLRRFVMDLGTVIRQGRQGHQDEPHGRLRDLDQQLGELEFQAGLLRHPPGGDHTPRQPYNPTALLAELRRLETLSREIDHQSLVAHGLATDPTVSNAPS